jgi:hypothetical protein
MRISHTVIHINIVQISKAPLNFLRTELVWEKDTFFYLTSLSLEFLLLELFSFLSSILIGTRL